MKIGQIVILAAAGWGAVKGLGRRPDPPLRYRVPPGQDPAAVLGLLHRHGFSAATEHVDGAPFVVVDEPAPRRRERADSLVRAAPLNLEGDQPAARTSPRQP